MTDNMAIGRVILDFDNTLFDADDFKVALASSLRQFGVSDELFWGTYRQARERGGDFGYSFERHVALVADRLPNLDVAAAVRALDAVLARAAEFLYPDAKEFLSRLISLGIPATLLTRGDPEFQRAKITSCGLDRLVEEVVVTKEPKIRRVGEILAAAQGSVYLIDDHLDATLEIYKAHPTIIPILKRRADQPPERYLGMRMLNFRHLSEIRDYLTIVHATNPTYGE